MSDLIKPEANIERLSRFQSLQAGQYWRAIDPVPEEGIGAGTVLLLQSIRYVDGAAHTIILRPHPTKIGTTTTLTLTDEDGTRREKWFRYGEHRFLTADFLALFEYEPDHQAVRERELKEIQGRVNTLQAELLDAQADPTILARVVEEELSKDGDSSRDNPSDLTHTSRSDQDGQGQLRLTSVADAIGTGISSKTIANLKQAAGQQHRVATIKSQWIQAKTADISQTISAMTPFYEEQAAAALAHTEDVRSYVSKLMEGIESLDLYVGKDVVIQTIREGGSAPTGEPLTFVQKKLMVDEELAVWADLDEWFDFGEINRFFEALREHDSLVNQIFPTERCVLVMATTRRHIDYGEPWANVARNSENAKVFLMVRDGMNIHQVRSPVESHLGSARLFPSTDDQDATFRGIDGTQVNFEDVAYTDKLAVHHQFALHYKRFLLLACGLDHRLKLFGDFYDGPPSLDFVSMPFQQKYCRFLHDDDGEGLLAGESRQPVMQWVAEKDQYLRAGSRVLCDWTAVMNPDTAPAACKRYRGADRMDRLYRPSATHGVAIVYRSGENLCVDVEVSGYTRNNEERSFKCKVNLSALSRYEWCHVDIPFLCLDAVRIEEVHWYIHHRKSRRDHLAYIRFFKHALQFLQHEREQERDTRERLAQALNDGSIASGVKAKQIVDSTVIAWRAANRGKPLPRYSDGSGQRAWRALLDQMYMLAGEGRRQSGEVAEYLGQYGYTPLRLILSGKAELIAYAAPREEERDDRIEPHAWTHRIVLERSKGGFKERSHGWALLPARVASETTLHEWPEAAEWAGKTSAFRSFDHKQAIFAEIEAFPGRLETFSCGPDREAFESEHQRWQALRQRLCERSNFVKNPNFAVPFGLALEPTSKNLKLLCVGTSNVHNAISLLAPDAEARQRLLADYVSIYANKGAALERFKEEEARGYPWSLLEANLSYLDEHDGGYFGAWCHTLPGKADEDPRLKEWYQRTLKEMERAGIQVWVADNVTDGAGDPVFDDLLGITLPEDYEPLDVVEFKLYDRSREEAQTHWFDICPRGTKREELLGSLNYQGSSSSMTKVVLTRSEAHTYIQSQVDKMNLASKAVQGEGEYSAPEGVERFFVVHVASNERD